MSAPSTWLTPQQLADELGQTKRWVERHMRAGTIPSIKVGRQRFFSPACREQMETAALVRDPDEGDAWGRITRRRAS